MRRMLLGLAAALAGVAGAQTAALFVGSDWDTASAAVRQTWERPGFATSVGAKTAVVDAPERVDDATRKAWEAQKAIRLEPKAYPAVAVFAASGDCVLLEEDVRSPSALAPTVREGLARAKTLEAAIASGDAERLGRALAPVVADLGARETRNRCRRAWEALEKADPEDRTGWRFAFTFDPAQDACYKVQDFAKRKDFAGGEAFIEALEAKPAGHLSANQRQGLMLLRYVLRRGEPGQAAAMDALLREVLAVDSHTHFGLAAQGLLCARGQGPVAIPYGWRQKDAADGRRTWPVTVGLAKTLREPGHYVLTLDRDKKARGGMRVEGVIFGGRRYGQAAALAPGKRAEVPFEVRPGDDLALGIDVSFSGAANERGTLALRPTLPPRPAAEGAFAWADAGDWATLRAKIPQATLDAIASRQGGEAFLRAFFADPGWVADFASSGDPLTDWPTALAALDAICAAVPEALASPVTRRWAAAAALNAAQDPTEAARLLRALLGLRAEGRLARGSDALRCDELRFVILPAQFTADDARWLAPRHNVPPRQYGGVCWSAPYRLHSFFGDSIHGRDYYVPWEHAYLRHERARKVGGVCGALSYYGSAAAKAHGVPSTPGGQPGHCAYTVWSPTQGRWTLAYNIAPYTGPHFALWGGRGRYAFQELAADAFARPGMRTSMRLLWAALDAPSAEAFRAAAEACPQNYAVWREWAAWLKGRKADARAWRAFGDRAAEGLRDHPDPAWEILQDGPVAALKGDRAALRDAFVAWHRVVRQGPQQTAEFCDYGRLLDAQAKAVGDDPETLFAIFETDLRTQFGTPDAFGKLMRWGGGRFLRDPALARRYVAAVNALLQEKGNADNALGRYVRESIREASQAGNAEAFHALCDLQDALNPRDRKPLDAKCPGTLLSARGLLRLSTTSGWDHPEHYRAVIDGLAAAGYFHTAREKTPWAEIRLPGMAEISGVWLLNRGDQNNGRLVPFDVEVSADGKAWTRVAGSDRNQGEYAFAFGPVRGDRVRVRCRPAKDTHLHLRKFCVYGKPLY